jgi:uncharacterized membrane protein YjgN (DUF898 family)
MDGRIGRYFYTFTLIKVSHFSGKLSFGKLYYLLIFLFTFLLMKTSEEQIPIITETKHFKDSE